jgi:hypothetical protein
MRTYARGLAWFATVVYLAFGLWAFAWPESFAERIASYPPYNLHLIHDLGAFQLGIGAAALGGLLLSDALAAVLAGVATASLMHGVSHILDVDHGGRAIDPWATSALGVAALVAFAAAARGTANRRAG